MICWRQLWNSFGRDVFSREVAATPEWAPAQAPLAPRVGGRVLFRDYGRYDEAQLRYKPGRKLAEHFYVKQDGTRCFYFDVADVRAAFEAAGFTVAALDFVCRQDANRATRTRRRRVFVQGTFEKPPPP